MVLSLKSVPLLRFQNSSTGSEKPHLSRCLFTRLVFFLTELYILASSLRRKKTDLDSLNLDSAWKEWQVSLTSGLKVMDINNHSNLSFNNNQVNRNNLTAFPGNGVLLNVRWNNAFCEILMLLTTSLDVKTERPDNTRQNLQVFWGKLHRSLPAATSAQLQLEACYTATGTFPWQIRWW